MAVRTRDVLDPRVERDIGRMARRMVLVPALGLGFVCVLLLLLVRVMVGQADELERALDIRAAMHDVRDLLRDDGASHGGVDLVPSAIDRLAGLVDDRSDAGAQVETLRALYPAAWAGLPHAASGREPTRVIEPAAVREDVLRRMRAVMSTMLAEEDVRIAEQAELVAKAKRGSAVGAAVVALALLVVGTTLSRWWLQAFARRYDDSLRAQDAAVRAKREFLAMLGHELRNPLAPMKLACELARRRGASANDWRTVEKQVDHMTRLVDDLLDVARVTRGRVELHPQRVELSSVVDRALEMVGTQLEQREQPLDVQISGDAVVDGDPQRLAQVVSHLLANASKYSDRGKAISVRARVVQGEVELRVRDRGIGIPLERQERVFEMFEQEAQDLDRSKGGLGLGLAIVKNLVELHGGHVHVESEGVGRGSELVVRLPLASAPAPAAAIVPSPTSVALRGRRVLVVDDNEDAADMMGELLTSLGCEVRVAYDSLSAIALVEQSPPEVALLDIGLPTMDGYELARHLRRAAGSGPAPLLIAVTGYGQESDRRRSFAAGFDQHLVKPVDLDALVRALG